jgi:hypothetical protein
MGGLLVVLTGSAVGFFANRRKAGVSQQPVLQLAAEPIDLSAQSQYGAQLIDLSVQSQNSAQPSELAAQSQYGGQLIDLSVQSQNGAQPIDLAAQSQNSAQPSDLSAQPENGDQEVVPHVASPEIAVTEAAVAVEAEEQVAATPTSTPSAVSASGGEKLDAAGEVLAPRPS